MLNKKRLIVELTLTLLLVTAALIWVRGVSPLLLVLSGPVVFYFIHFISFDTLSKILRPRLLTHMGVIFLLVLAFPYLDGLMGAKRRTKLFRLQEKRLQSKKPEFRWDNCLNYLKELTPYYNDHFRFRWKLIYINNWLKIKYFGVSPLPLVVLGKEGFLYYAKESETLDAVEYYRSVNLFKKNQLEHWRKILQERKDWLAKRGIEYLVLIVPNKSTIYPEYMPDHIRKASDRSRMDQLLDYMKKHSDVPMLDLRPALLESKKQKRCYHKTDSHWNEFGAYWAYREIITNLPGEHLKGTPLPRDHYKLDVRNRVGGDLAILLNMQRRLMREDRVKMDLRHKRRYRKGTPVKHPYAISAKVTVNPHGDLPGAIMVHDSFGDGIIRYLSGNFRRITYVFDWGLNFYPALIEADKPKIVIEEMAERFLMDKELKNPW